VPLTIPRQTIERFSKCHTPDALRDEIWNSLGTSLHSLDIMFNRILVAIYVRPERSSGGVYFAQQTKEEDLWQGKVGLVLKMGDDAFKDDPAGGYYFGGQRAVVGEWVVFKIGDTWDLLVNDVPCRLIEDAHIKIKAADPRIIY
jgi:hypothetical protein